MANLLTVVIMRTVSIGSMLRLRHRLTSKTARLVFLGLPAVIMTACSHGSGQSPVDVQVQVKSQTLGTEYNGDVAVGPGLSMSWDEITIVSKVDQVVINDVVVNRGNCHAPGNGAYLPRTLSFGQHLDIAMYQCDVTEVTIETDQGNWTSSFQSG